MEDGRLELEVTAGFPCPGGCALVNVSQTVHEAEIHLKHTHKFTQEQCDRYLPELDPTRVTASKKAAITRRLKPTTMQTTEEFE